MTEDEYMKISLCVFLMLPLLAFAQNPSLGWPVQSQPAVSNPSLGWPTEPYPAGEKPSTANPSLDWPKTPFDEAWSKKYSACVGEMNKAYAKLKVSPNFAIGNGQFILVDNDSVHIYSERGSTKVTGLSCDTNRQAKTGTGIAKALNDMVMRFSDGVTGDPKDPKYTFTQKSSPKKSALEAVVRKCGEVDDSEIYDTYQKLTSQLGLTSQGRAPQPKKGVR